MERITNDTMICFNEWKEQLIYNKKKVFWIAKDDVKYYLWSKKPLLKDNGDIDYDKLSIHNRQMEINTYRYILDNKIELLTKDLKYYE